MHAKVVSENGPERKISRFCPKSGDFGLRRPDMFCVRTRIQALDVLKTTKVLMVEFETNEILFHPNVGLSNEYRRLTAGGLGARKMSQN